MTIKTKPIFKVTIKTQQAEEVRLVRAMNGPQARAFVTEGTITVEKASQDDLIEYGKTVQVETVPVE